MKLLKKGGLLLILKLLSAFVALVFHYLLAKQLTAEQFGLYSLVFTCILFTSVVAKQGLEQTAIRFIAKASLASKFSNYIKVLSFSLTSAVITLLLILILFSTFAENVLLKPQLNEFVFIIAIFTLTSSLLAINSAALKGFEQPFYAMLVSGLITYTLSSVSLYFFPVSSAYQAINVVLITSSFSMVVSFIFIRIGNLKAIKTPKALITSNSARSDQVDQGENSSYKQLYKSSRRLFVISLAALLTQQMSVLVLSANVSLAEVGYYSLAIKISLIMSYPLLVINAITSPKYAQLFSSNKYGEFKRLALSVTSSLVVIATISLITLYVSIDWILSLFGDDYYHAASIVKILIIGQWFNLATGSVVSMLLMSGYEKLHRRNTLIITTINMIALFVLIPIYGVIAAAIITAIIMATKNLVALYFVNKLIYRKAKT